MHRGYFSKTEKDGSQVTAEHWQENRTKGIRNQNQKPCKVYLNTEMDPRQANYISLAAISCFI